MTFPCYLHPFENGIQVKGMAHVGLHIGLNIIGAHDSPKDTSLVIFGTPYRANCNSLLEERIRCMAVEKSFFRYMAFFLNLALWPQNNTYLALCLLSVLGS